jgi:hypothetical protein
MLRVGLPEARAEHIVWMIADITSGRASVQVDPEIAT